MLSVVPVYLTGMRPGRSRRRIPLVSFLSYSRLAMLLLSGDKVCGVLPVSCAPLLRILSDPLYISLP